MHAKQKFRQACAMALVLLCQTSTGWAQAGAGGTDGSIDKCNAPLGTLAVAEPQSHMLASLSQFKLGSPSTMLRMIAQESGCFTVVERGVGMQNIQQERALASGGMLQQDSNLGAGQLQAADFVMTPSVQFADSTGGVGATVGNWLGRAGGLLGTLGGLAGGIKFKEAETTLLVADVRSGIQVASAEGKASKMDFSLGGWGWGGMGWASAGGYSKTPEGKLIAASLLDNYNRIVQTIRDKPSLIQSTSAASKANAARSVQATNATRPSAVAAPAASPMSNNGLPASMTGIFAGTFGGREQGTFNAVVSANGMISGSAYSTTQGLGFVTSGIVTPQGDVQMTGSGQSGSITFIGRIDPSNGTINGQWRAASVSGKPGPVGDFGGQKQ